ncbi:hypothetical protein [Microvirga sp. G4-2]|uniref:hypothetical protein n=1 Tax=Microvirga sp. G4-2 TaxID=3434467 RepID=UPI004043B8AA
MKLFIPNLLTSTATTLFVRQRPTQAAGLMRAPLEASPVNPGTPAEGTALDENLNSSMARACSVSMGQPVELTNDGPAPERGSLEKLAQLSNEDLAYELWCRIESFDLTCPQVHDLIRRTSGSSIYAAELQKWLPEVIAAKGNRRKRRPARGTASALTADSAAV